MLFSHAKFGQSRSPFLNQQLAPYDSPYSQHLFIGSLIMDMESGLHSRSQAWQAAALPVCGAFVRGVQEFPACRCQREGHGAVSAWTDGLASCARAVCKVCMPGIQKSSQFSDAERDTIMHLYCHCAMMIGGKSDTTQLCRGSCGMMDHNGATGKG